VRLRQQQEMHTEHLLSLAPGFELLSERLQPIAGALQVQDAGRTLHRTDLGRHRCAGKQCLRECEAVAHAGAGVPVDPATPSIKSLPLELVECFLERVGHELVLAGAGAEADADVEPCTSRAACRAGCRCSQPSCARPCATPAST